MKPIIIYYINVKNLMQAADRLCLPTSSFEIQYQIFLSLLDPAVQTRILRYRKEIDRLRSLASQLLLYHAFYSANPSPDNGSFSISYNSYGKPFFKNYPAYTFSLSHSGSYAVCAFNEASSPVGIDIQEYRPLNRDRICQRFYTDLEKDSAESVAMFFRIWSAKEAYMKYTGKGFSEGLDTFSVLPESAIVVCSGSDSKTLAYLQEPLMLPGYSCSLCTASRVIPGSVSVCELTEADLFTLQTHSEKV